MTDMETPDRPNRSLSAEEMRSRREIHEASRHSLRLEGLDGFLTAEDDAQAEAWIRGEITLEKAIEDTLEKIRGGFL
ncbi:MAG: antitoxin VbhA family protein [Rhodospirillales bacterium]|nr:antitoxin VbhA family protein [Acetobacter sp.]